jgi:hypothetical protein
MSLHAAVIVVFAGWLVGMLVFGMLFRWLAVAGATIGERTVLRRGGGIAKTVVVILARSTLHAAPWLLLVVSYFAYHVRSEPWSTWLYVGFAAAFIFMGVGVGLAGARILRERKARSHAG